LIHVFCHPPPTCMVEHYYEMINNSIKISKAMLLAPNKHIAISLIVTGMFTRWDGFCCNPSLGLVTKARACKVIGQKGAQKSHHMLLGLQRMQRVWGNEPSHSQVNSHCGSWSPKWTLEFSECSAKGQNPSVGKVIYIIGKILKRRCLQWAHMTHLDIWNTSYDQKKGRESNWQFDS
jgi:hypothetical protein